MLLVLVVILIGATGFVAAEYSFQIGPPQKRLWDGIWWAFVTLCTVGYGDIYPRTVAGRIFGIGLMLTGYCILSIITAKIASILVEKRIRQEKGLESVTSTEHIVICGWNEYVQEILDGIILSGQARNEIILINELSEEEMSNFRFNYAKSLSLSFIHGDYTSESVLTRANVAKADSVIFLADTRGERGLEKADERTILATLAVKSMAPKARVYAEILNRNNVPHLRRARVDDVIVRGEHSGFLLANASLAPGIHQVFKELLDFRAGNNLARMPFPKKFIGKTFKTLSLYLRETERAILVGLVSEVKNIDLDDILSQDSSAIDDFIKATFAEAGEDLNQDNRNISINLNPDDSYIIKENEMAVVIMPPGKKG
ncbi:MAG: potassium channel family protein [bacterium]